MPAAEGGRTGSGHRERLQAGTFPQQWARLAPESCLPRSSSSERYQDPSEKWRVLGRGSTVQDEPGESGGDKELGSAHKKEDGTCQEREPTCRSSRSRSWNVIKHGDLPGCPTPPAPRAEHVLRSK